MPTEPTNPLDFPPLDGMSRLAGLIPDADHRLDNRAAWGMNRKWPNQQRMLVHHMP